MERAESVVLMVLGVKTCVNLPCGPQDGAALA